MNSSSEIWLVFSVPSCQGKVGSLWGMNKLVSAAIVVSFTALLLKGCPLFIYITQFCHLTQIFYAHTRTCKKPSISRTPLRN